MERLPLTILLGPENEAVVYEKELIAGLTKFELDASYLVRTTFTCVNCFPRPSGHRIQDLSAYPLRIHVGDDVNEIVVSYAGKPLGWLRSVYVALSATEKRIIRITSYVPLPDELNTALLDLGVEVIIDPPDDPKSAGGDDAHL